MIAGITSLTPVSALDLPFRSSTTDRGAISRATRDPVPAPSPFERGGAIAPRIGARGDRPRKMGPDAWVLLAQSRAPAAATLMTLLEQAKSEHVRKDVAVTLLGYSGFHHTGDRGPLVSVAVGGGPGYIIDLTPGGDETARFNHVGPAGGVVYDRDNRGDVIDVTTEPPEDE